MMAKRIVQLGIVLTLLINLPVLADDNTSTKCQFGKPLRKQVNPERLNGMCLRDIVIQLSKSLRSLTNEELMVTFFQETIDKLESTNISKNLKVHLNKLVDKLNNKLASYTNILRQSSAIVQQILLNKNSHSLYHNQMMEMDILHNQVTDICAQITDALSGNFRTQEWKNLHVLPVNQPGVMCGLSSLANNIGPLLLSHCSSSKNVIILIEHATFMSERDLALAQMTAKSILDVLSDNDYVTVIGLASHNYVHCGGSLMHATDVNKYHLAFHVDNMTRADTNRTVEIDFKTLMQNVDGEVVIIHLTNTLRDTSNISHIMERISSTGHIAHLRTILISPNRGSEVNMSEIAKNHTILILPTQNVLGYEIAKLFSGLKCSQDRIEELYLSDPYFEPYSKSMTLSIGEISDAAFLSLNIKMQDFLDDITYFNAGSDVYAVLFDKKEIVWMHKTFPRMEMIVEQPLKVYIGNIENIEKETVSTMIRQLEGVLDVKTKLGIKKQYRWKHLDNSKLIVCIVSITDEGTLPVVKSVPPLPTSILHHRLDLMLQTVLNKDKLCAYQNKITTLSTGVVYLSPWCFQSPMEQLKHLETGTAVTVQSYMAYIKDLTGLLANPGLHQSVRPDVATLAQVLEQFKKRHMDSPLNKFIIRRYIVSTASGVLEVFPGMVLDPGLDPKRRAWYGKALEHRGKIVFTTPYLDAAGAGYVITLSHTIYDGRSAELHTINDPIMAVLSMDLPMAYISRLLIENFPFCNDSTVKCFLMDDKGYLVSHPSLLEPTGKVEQQHLTHKELLVANDILNHEYFLKKKLCANHLDGTIQRYYQFNTSLEEVLTNILPGEHCIKYQVAAVPGTNVFLGVVNVTCSLTRAFCPCSTKDRLCFNCKRMEQTICECPCECSLYTTDCVQTYQDDLEACPAPYEQGISSSTPWMQSTRLNLCPTFNCKTYDTEGECLGVVGCQWCYIDSDGETPLETPYCSDMSLCFKGIFGSFVPYNEGAYNSQATEETSARDWPSVGPVAGGILAFVLILGVILFCYRLRSVHSGLEHQCLHLHTSPDTLRMTPLEGDTEPMELNQTKNNLDSLIRDNTAPISPYRVSTNYRRPPGGDSDHGYSTMTPHDDSEQQTFVEPLILASDVEPDLMAQSGYNPSSTTQLGSPHHVLAPVTVHRHMEANYC